MASNDEYQQRSFHNKSRRAALLDVLRHANEFLSTKIYFDTFKRINKTNICQKKNKSEK